MEDCLKISAAVLYAVSLFLSVNEISVFGADRFPYSKCNYSLGNVTCERLNVTKVHHEEEASLWPPGPYAVPDILSRGCPEPSYKGWKRGVVNIKSSEGKNFKLKFCVKIRQHSELNHTNWIPGIYDIYKAGEMCPDGFKDTNQTMNSTHVIGAVTQSGYVPAFVVDKKSDGIKITFSMCERNSSDVNIHVTDTEFLMLQTEFSLVKKTTVTCQQFRGTFAREISLSDDVEANFCLYMPDKVPVENSNHYYWIGARYDSIYKEHRWIDGSVMMRNGWGEDKPGSVKGCVNYARPTNYMWSSYHDCGLTTSPFICEKECDGWELFNKSCYLFMIYSHLSWIEAESFCESQDSRLVIVEDDTEHQYIRQKFRGFGLSYMWIGARYDPIYNEHRWIDGTAMTFNGWAPNRPGHSEGCVDYLHYQEVVIQWNSHEDCNNTQGPFVCEKDCGTGWQKLGKNCYYISSIGRSWEGAKVFCESEEGSLLIVDDEYENTYIRQKLLADQAGNIPKMMSDFSMTTGNLSGSVLNILAKTLENNSAIIGNYTWYQLDIGRTLSVAKIEILTNASLQNDNNEWDDLNNKELLHRNSYVYCYYDDLRWSFMYLEAAACQEETTVNKSSFSLHMRHVRARFITLIFDETSGIQTITSKQSIQIFLSDINEIEFCNEDLGMSDGTINDQQISASSWLPEHLPAAGRPFSAGWCAEEKGTTPWILVDLKVVSVVEGFSIWPLEKRTKEDDNGCYSIYVNYGLDIDALTVYNDMDFNVELSRSETEMQDFLLINPIKTRYIQFEFSQCPGNQSRCLKFEIRGCKISDTVELSPTLIYPEGDFVANLEYVERDTVIASIGYPYSGGGQDYMWIIRFPEHRYVRLAFSEASLSNMYQSCYDKVLLSKAIRSETTGREINHRFNKRDFVIETSESLLYLTTRFCIGRFAERGFRAVVTGEDPPACLSIDSKVPWDHGRKEVCTETSMFLTSMSMLNLPYVNIEERWEIHAGGHSSIQLHIIDFYVVCLKVSGETSSRFEVVESTQELLFCSTNRPPDVIYSQTSDVCVKFQQYENLRNTFIRTEGFRLQYSTNAHSIELKDITHFKTKVCSKKIGKCYDLFLRTKNWYQARQFCSQIGENLVTVHSKYEMQLIHYLLRDFTIRHNILDSSRCHIGFRRYVKDGREKFVWSDSSLVTYSAWTTGNPSDKGDCTRTHFLLFTNDTWESEDCFSDYTKIIICQSQIGETDYKTTDSEDATNTAFVKQNAAPVTKKTHNESHHTAEFLCQNTALKFDKKVNVTYTGKTCQNWNNLDRTARNNLRQRFPLLEIPSDFFNECQDLDSTGLPWCYPREVDDDLWEPCFVYPEENNDKDDQNKTASMFRCDGNRQIPNVYRCDKTFDCRDLSDEISCEDSIKWHQLFTNVERNRSTTIPTRLDRGQYFFCGSKELIHILARCDGVIDCLDASDEMNCRRPSDGCAGYEFTCNDGSCVHNSQVCDFHSDCLSDEDELCVDCKDSFRCDVVKCISHQLVCNGVEDCEDGIDESNCEQSVIYSCDGWWELGYRISGQYMIDGVNVFCDFSDVSDSGGKVKMTFRNIDVNVATQELYTHSLHDNFIQLNDPRFLKLMTNSKCFLQLQFPCQLKEVQTTCPFYSRAAVDLHQYETWPYCQCTVETFRIAYNVTLVKQDQHFLRGNETFENVTEVRLLLSKSEQCGEKPSDQYTRELAKNTRYYSVASSDTFYVDDRVLRKKVPIDITTGPITCIHDYRSDSPRSMMVCEGENKMIPTTMQCIYDLDNSGLLKGCMFGSHLEDCGNFSCPKNTVKCPGSFCIPIHFVCDGNSQCPNGQDEHNCTCSDSAKEVIILLEEPTDNMESYTAAEKLSEQFYSSGIDIRLLKFTPSSPQYLEQYLTDGFILNIKEEMFNPSAFQKCVHDYKLLARNVLGNIFNASNHLRAFVFIENNVESSVIANSIWYFLSNETGFMNYRVSTNDHFTLNDPMRDTSRIVREVPVNRWSELFSMGYRRFPEICKAATEVPCYGGYRCLSSKQCITVEQICDGIAQCTGEDDERFCDNICPENCTCVGYTINCRGASLAVSEIVSMSMETRIADFSDNPNIKNVLIRNIIRLPLLLKLNLSICEIENIDKYAFSSLTNLTWLDIGYNRIKQLPSNVFSNLSQLVYLNLDGNFELSEISPTAFQGMKSIRSLRITNTKLKRISAFTFSYLTLKSINISYNEIEEIEDFAFSNISVEKIDFSGNDIKYFNKFILSKVSLLRELRTPAFKFCCLRPCYLEEENCYPTKNEFSSCEDLMRHPVLQAILWQVGIAALLGNFGSIIYRLVYDRERLKIGYGIFVTNLAAADFLMGVYLIIIAVVDSLYRKRYIFMDDQWRNSKWCVTAGMLSTVSSEASVLFLCLITLDRLIVIKYPFGNVRFGPKKAHISCLVSWMIAFALALIPLIHTSYFQGKFYSRSGVCVALPLTRDKPPGWMYSVTIFVGLNFCTFILVAFGQLSIFLELRRATRGIKKTQKSRKRDLQVARNLIFVATTDFLCWFPVGVMGIMALNGFPIPGDVYAWTAVFILPLNSALNPILYTLTAIIGKQVCLIVLYVLLDSRYLLFGHIWIQQSFNPSTEEQDRTEIQKEIGSTILKHQDLIQSVRIKRPIAPVGKSLHDLLQENEHMSSTTVIAIGMHLAKYLSLLHESSIGIDQLTKTTTYIDIDKKKNQRVSVVLDSKTSLVTDGKVMQDNIYQFGILLRRLVAKCKNNTDKI